MWSAKSTRFSGGGGVVAEFFRGLRKPTRFSGGGVVAEFFRRLYNSRRDLMGPFYIFWHSRRGGPGPPPLWIGHCILTDEHTQSFMCNGQINEHMSCEQWHNYFHTNYTHLFSAQSESIDTSLTHIMPLFSLLQGLAGRITCAIWLSHSALSPKEIFEKAYMQHLSSYNWRNIYER